MTALSGAAVFLQQDSLTRHDIHLAMIFLAIIALALVVQAVGVLISSAFGAKLLHRVNSIADIVEHKTGPILDRTSAILTDLAPRVKSVGDKAEAISANVEHISTSVRDQVTQLSVTVAELNATVRDINGRTRALVVRADNIVSDAMHATEEISQTVQNGIKGPVRQIAGVIAGLKAGIETLVARSPFGNKGPASRFDDFE
jgi:methyl-accepting chemotaxis protein